MFTTAENEISVKIPITNQKHFMSTRLDITSWCVHINMEWVDMQAWDIPVQNIYSIINELAIVYFQSIKISRVFYAYLVNILSILLYLLKMCSKMFSIKYMCTFG